MSRLYYEKRSNALRGLSPLEQRSNFNDYLEKISHLIPGEIITGYLTTIGLISLLKSIHMQTILMWIMVVFWLILTPVYLNKVADADKPKRNHLILSTIAFLVWAYVTLGKQLFASLSPELFNEAIASLVLVIFCAISAVIPLNK